MRLPRTYFVQTQINNESIWTMHGSDMGWQEAVNRVDRLLTLKNDDESHMYEAVRVVEQNNLRVQMVSRRMN